MSKAVDNPHPILNEVRQTLTDLYSRSKDRERLRQLVELEAALDRRLRTARGSRNLP